MGEYAKYNGREVKIGTCENQYYLRADQARSVQPLRGNVDPVKDAAAIRFRFPFPDEDQVGPGAFKDPFRVVEVNALLSPLLVKHAAGCDGRVVGIAQQRLVGEALVLICECPCGVKYRIPTLAEAAPVVKACIREARRASLQAAPRLGSATWRLVARRIVAGYRRNEGARS